MVIEERKKKNAEELFNAVFSEGGPKNTKMCVLEIHKSVAKWEGVHKITTIIVWNSKQIEYCIENISTLAKENFMTTTVCEIGMVTFSYLFITIIFRYNICRCITCS